MSSSDTSDLVKAPPINDRPLLSATLIRATGYCWFVIGGMTYLRDLLGQTVKGLTNGSTRPFGDDFVNFWSAAWLAWHGRTNEIYNFDAFHAFHQKLVGPGLQLYHYSYPPVLLILTAPFSLVPYVPALGLWLVSSWYAFYRALQLSTSKSVLLFSLATPALFINALGGQNGAWTAALLGGGLLLLDCRPILSGILLGVLVYKPHLALMLPVALVAGRRWQTILAGGFTATALLALSVGLFGLDIWQAYLQQLGILRVWILEDGTGVWHRMMSVFVFAKQLGFSVPHAYIVQIVTGLTVAAVVAWAWIRNVSAAIRNALVVLGTCLATPYLLDYDFVISAFVAIWLQQSSDQLKISPRARQILQILVLMLPITSAALSQHTGIVFGPLVIGAVFIVFARSLLPSNNSTKVYSTGLV